MRSLAKTGLNVTGAENVCLQTITKGYICDGTSARVDVTVDCAISTKMFKSGFF